MLGMVRKYSSALALTILIGFCGYFCYAFAVVDRVRVQEKIIDLRLAVDMICDQIDYRVYTDKNWGRYDYKSVLSEMTQKIDARQGVYAELFDNSLESLSSARTPTWDEKPFDPHEYPELMEAVRNNERDTVKVVFAVPGQQPHDVYVYFRWVPTDVKLDKRLLVMMGCSKFSINTKLGSEIVYGAVALMLVSAFLIVSNVITRCQLGYIYKLREGADKWRERISL